MNSSMTKGVVAASAAALLAVASFGRRRIYFLLEPVAVVAMGRRRFVH